MKNSTTNTLEITVIVSTYNRPDALDLTLCALNEQDYPDFEIIIADDGSDEATAALIREHEVCRQRAVHHVWQPDEGFRKAEVHNKAIFKASGAYIVFVDGDCVPGRNFLSRHAALAQKGRFVTGGRIALSRTYTDGVLANRVLLHRLTLKNWVWMRLTRNVNHLLYFFFFRMAPGGTTGGNLQGDYMAATWPHGQRTSKPWAVLTSATKAGVARTVTWLRA